MRDGQETGGESIDPRRLSWDQRYALKRRAIAFAHEERARVRGDAARRVWSVVVRTARRATFAAAVARPALSSASRRP